MKFLSQGAEAKIFLHENKIIKERIKKKYRIDELDQKIRKMRTRSEAKILSKASTLIPAPQVIKTDQKEIIELECIQGKQVKEIIDSLSAEERKKINIQIGNNLAILHNNDIVHHDLTTSNMIVNKGTVYFIDFGLSFISKKNEDKAVDIHLFKSALEAKHHNHFEKSFQEFLQGYKQKSDTYNEVIKQLEKVEKRGRYKQKI